MGGGNYGSQMDASLRFIASAALRGRTAGMSTCDERTAAGAIRGSFGFASVLFCLFALPIRRAPGPLCSGWYVTLPASSCRSRDGGGDEALHSLVGLRRESREELHG